MNEVFEHMGEALAELAGMEHAPILPAPRAALALSVALPADGRILEALGWNDTPHSSQPDKYPATFIRSGTVDESTLQSLREVIDNLPLQDAEFQNTVRFTPSGEIVFEMLATTPEENTNEHGDF